MESGNVSTFSLILEIIFVVIIAAAQWKVFTKAGEAGWKAIIPIYNSYTIFKFSWKIPMFWVWLVVGTAMSTTYSLSGNQNMTLLGIAGILAIVSIVLSLMSIWYVCKSFGKGVGFFLGYVFIPIIFVPMLGFGSAQYLGNAGKKEV